MTLLRPCFARTQTWLQARKYISALASSLPSVNGWTIAEECGDRSPDAVQRLLNRASWDEMTAMSLVRVHAAAGLDREAERSRRYRMAVGALDETGQEKHGTATAGAKRQYMGCAGRVANGINTVHLAYVREKIRPRPGRRAAVDPRRAGEGPGEGAGRGAAGGPGVSHQGPAGHRYPRRRVRRRAQLRLHRRRRSVRKLHETARVPGRTGPGLRAAGRILVPPRTRHRYHDLRGHGEDPAEAHQEWEIRPAGQGSKGERWYAWAQIATSSPRHTLLVRRHC